jgi:uncharacterized protein
VLAFGSTQEMVVILATIVVTHWLGGIAVFGSTLLALPVLAWLMPIQSARTLLLIVGTVQAWQMCFHTYRGIDGRQLGRMVLFAGAGIPVGIYAVRHLPAQPLFIALGVVLVVSGATRLLPAGAKLKWPGWLLNGLLVAGGIVHGAFVTGGALVVVYAQHALAEKDTFRGTLNAFWVILNAVLIADLFRDDHPIGSLAPLLLWAIPLILVTTWVAHRTARRLPQEQFARLVAALLVVAGIVTAARAFWWQT